MMNDKEFREKCREIIYYQLDALDQSIEAVKKDGFEPDFDPKVAQAVSLLYIASNMPGLDEIKPMQ